MSKLMRRLALSLAVLVGGLGILLIPQALPFMIWSGATAAVIGYHVPRSVPRILGPARTGRGTRALNAALVVMGAGSVLVGLGALVGAPVAVLAGGVGAVLLCLGRRTHGRAEGRAGRQDGGQAGWRPAPAAPPPIATSVSGMSTPQLCWAWRTSYLALQGPADARTLDRLAAVRRCYLDELEHRDPAGFRRWLESGARAPSDPLRYIRADAEPGTRDAGATG